MLYRMQERQGKEPHVGKWGWLETIWGFWNPSRNRRNQFWGTLTICLTALGQGCRWQNPKGSCFCAGHWSKDLLGQNYSFSAWPVWGPWAAGAITQPHLMWLDLVKLAFSWILLLSKWYWSIFCSQIRVQVSLPPTTKRILFPVIWDIPL